MRKLVVGAACALALLAPAAALAKPQRHRADGHLRDWRGKPSMIAGRAVLSRGELIYDDYLYDDYGPDLDGMTNSPPFRSNLAKTRGDYRYPDDAARYGYNAADLRELRLAATRRGLSVLIELQTMKRANAAITTLAIDGDGRRSGDSKRWPDGIGLTTPDPDRFVTTWGKRARLTTPRGVRRVRSAVNLKKNAIEVQVPWRALRLRTRRPRLWIVTGLNDGHGRYMQQKQGETAVFDAGFDAHEQWPRFDGAFGENVQAADLAKGDVGPLSRAVRLRRMLRRRSDRRRPLAPGFYNRIFRSRYGYGEGIDLKATPLLPTGQQSNGSIPGTSKPMFLSRYQPYGLYIPKGYTPRRRAPLTLDGHSLDVNQNEYVVSAPHQLEQLGDERGSVIITPLARGIDTWYLDAGLADVLEAWRDVRRHYSIDTRRTSITGYSMGGYMTYRMGLLMPDRFARASVYVGPPAYYFWPYPGELQTTPQWSTAGNTNLIVENALDLPYEVVDGNADELVPITGVQHQVDTMQAAGDAFRFYRHSADDHFSFILGDEWAHTRDWLGDYQLQRNPVEVRYKRYPAMDLPRYGLRFDSAYWVSGIVVRQASQPSDFGLVDATTYGLGGARTRPEMELPQAVSGPTTPGTVTEQRRVPAQSISKRNGFEATLQNLGAVTFDLRRMGLTLSRGLAAHVASDGPAALTLVDGKRRRVLHVGSGESDVVLAPGG